MPETVFITAVYDNISCKHRVLGMALSYRDALQAHVTQTWEKAKEGVDDELLRRQQRGDTFEPSDAAPSDLIRLDLALAPILHPDETPKPKIFEVSISSEPEIEELDCAAEFERELRNFLELRAKEMGADLTSWPGWE